MYKLIANLPNGITWVCRAPSVPELQRIAVNLGAVGYSVYKFDDLVYQG